LASGVTWKMPQTPVVAETPKVKTSVTF